MRVCLQYIRIFLHFLLSLSLCGSYAAGRKGGRKEQVKGMSEKARDGGGEEIILNPEKQKTPFR